MERNFKVFAVCQQLHAAIVKAIDAGPNRQDYAHQAPAMYELVRAEHINRVQRLQALQIEFEQLAAADIPGSPDNWTSRAVTRSNLRFA